MNGLSVDLGGIEERPYGVYLLANDVSLDWFKALIRTLRSHNPSIPVILIPFDSRIKRIQALSAKYNFHVWQDLELLKEFDQVGSRFHPDNSVGAQMYRKLACFSGPLRHFVYLDSDVVVNRSIQPLLDLVKSDRPGIVAVDRESVDAIYTRGSPVLDRIDSTRLFNAGAFASSRGVVPAASVVEYGARNRELQNQFVSGEQSCLNLLIQDGAVEVRFAADEGIGFPATTFAINLAGVVDESWEDPPLIHWAGCSLSPHMPLRRRFIEARCDPRRPLDALLFLIWTSRLRPHVRTVWRYLRRLGPA